MADMDLMGVDLITFWFWGVGSRSLRFREGVFLGGCDHLLRETSVLEAEVLVT